MPLDVATESMPAISAQIWREKYRKSGERSPLDTFARVAAAVAIAEKEDQRHKWANEFNSILYSMEFLPAGRILAGAGTGRRVSLVNCFVMGRIEDDMGSIFESVKESALTMQQGGGIGVDFSTIRPKGAPVKGVGSDASGPVSFMHVWDAMCRTVMSAGSRRGAMMGVLRCDHPDIFDFINAKRDGKSLRNFNISVAVTDKFMEAVDADAEWPLGFNCETTRVVRARELWEAITRSAYECAEPGVLFIDHINQDNPLAHCEYISATNPCGEQPLPPYGACVLGSINLTKFILDPFEINARIDFGRLHEVVPTAVRFLDNVIDVSEFPLEQQRTEAMRTRRIGLGVAGLADALIMLGQKYADFEARSLMSLTMERIGSAALAASGELAKEKGAFPARVLGSLRRRNGCLTSIAPNGTTGLFAGVISGGIEPVFDWSYARKIIGADGEKRELPVEDYAYRLFREKFGSDTPLPDYFVTAHDISPDDHLLMQAALQPHVDAAISKTVNCPGNIPLDEFSNIYWDAHQLGLKGVTAYRPNSVTGAVLTRAPAKEAQLSLPLPVPDVPTTGPAGCMVQPMDRDPALAGFTYKLRWPESDHAIYVTVNDIIHDGQRRPFEIFINSKNMEHYAWTVALTRMISAVFRRGGDVSFVADELKAVFDPRGGQWAGGRYVPSLQAAVGGVIEQHMVNIGFVEPGGAPVQAERGSKTCPHCGAPSVTFQEGCFVCHDCGHSKCG